MGGGASKPQVVSAEPQKKEGNVKKKQSQKQHSKEDRTDERRSCDSDDNDRSHDQHHKNSDDTVDENVPSEVIDPVAAAYSVLSQRVDPVKVKLLTKTYTQQDTVQAPPRGMDATAALETALALSKNKSVTSVDVSQQRLGRLGLLFLVRQLATIPSLTSLQLGHTHCLGSGGGPHETPQDRELPDSTVACSALAALLRSGTAPLRTLGLEVAGLTGPDGVALAEGLAGHRSLKHLRASDNLLGDQGVAAIGAALSAPSPSHLHLLDLSGNQVGVSGAKGLGAALRGPGCRLATLLLDRNQLGAEGCEVLASAMKENKSLKVLSLWKTGMGNDGAQELARALAVNDSLLELNVGDNGLDDRGIGPLVLALRKNTSLASLAIWYNTIGEKGMRALASTLKANSPLTSLNVHSMRGLSGSLALLLGDALRVNSRLTTLDVGGNQLDPPALQLFVSLLRRSQVSVLRTLHGVVLTDFLDELGMEYSVDLNNASILAAMQGRLRAVANSPGGAAESGAGAGAGSLDARRKEIVDSLEEEEESTTAS